jgi:hypothetical protein
MRKQSQGVGVGVDVGVCKCRCMHLAITSCSLMGVRWLPSGYYHLSEPKLWDYMLHKDQ